MATRELTAFVDRLLERAAARETDGDGDGARRILDSAPPEVRRDARVQLALGTLAFRAGELDPAISAFEAAMSADPNNPDLAANLGAALLERADLLGDPGDIERAQSVLETAAAQGPKLPYVHNHLGLAYLALDRAEDALGAFELALKIGGAFETIWYNQAAAFDRLKRYQDAIDRLEYVIELDHTHQEAWASLVSVLLKMGRGDEAADAIDGFVAAGGSPETAAALRARLQG